MGFKATLCGRGTDAAAAAAAQFVAPCREKTLKLIQTPPRCLSGRTMRDRAGERGAGRGGGATRELGN